MPGAGGPGASGTKRTQNRPSGEQGEGRPAHRASYTDDRCAPLALDGLPALPDGPQAGNRGCQSAPAGRGAFPAAREKAQEQEEGESCEMQGQQRPEQKPRHVLDEDPAAIAPAMKEGEVAAAAC